jgi:anti-sigma B factor antagonist
MQAKVRLERGARIVAFSGEIDLESSPAAREVLLGAVREGGSVYADLSGVEYIDSSGVASFVEAYQLARQMDVVFGLVSVSASAMRVIQLARLDKVFPIHDSMEAAGLGGA